MSESALARSVLFLVEHAKLVAEPAGAAATAHLLELGQQVAGQYEGPVVAVISGGNIDPVLLQRILRKGMTVAGRYLQLQVRMPDGPGNLARLLARLAELRCSVIEVQHQRRLPDLAVNEVAISVTLETMGHEHAAEAYQTLVDDGYRVER